MVHLAPLPAWRRRAQRIVGFALAALGVAVLVIAVIALRQPNGHQAALHTSPVGQSSSIPAPSSSSSTPAPPVSSSSSVVAPPPVSSTASSPSSSPADPVKSVPIIVLNNTNRSGLADTAASRFRAGGWTVTSTGNLDNQIVSTVAYYDPATANSQAAATALQVQFPAIKRVVARFAELPAGPIVVVLTSDYS